MMVRPAGALIGVAVVLLAIAACGGSDGGASERQEEREQLDARATELGLAEDGSIDAIDRCEASLMEAGTEQGTLGGTLSPAERELMGFEELRAGVRVECERLAAEGAIDAEGLEITSEDAKIAFCSVPWVTLFDSDAEVGRILRAYYDREDWTRFAQLVCERAIERDILRNSAELDVLFEEVAGEVGIPWPIPGQRDEVQATIEAYSARLADIDSRAYADPTFSQPDAVSETQRTADELRGLLADFRAARPAATFTWLEQLWDGLDRVLELRIEAAEVVVKAAEVGELSSSDRARLEELDQERQTVTDELEQISDPSDP